MLGHYLVTLYRSLTRHRLYAALNVFGLAVGIAVFLVLWLDVRFETSFEKWIPDAKQIYVVDAKYRGSMSSLDETDNSMGGLLDELKAEYPQLVGVRFDNDRITVLQNGRPTPENIKEVDPSFFSVFDIPLLYGDRAHAFDRPDGLVVKKSKAEQYFGTANALGRPLTLIVQGKAETHRVTGVIPDPPASSDLKFSMLIPLTPRIVSLDKDWRHWGSFSVYTYLRFDSPTAAAVLDADLDRFVDRHAATDMGPHPSSTLEMHTRPLLSRHLAQPRDRATVEGLLAVGVLILILATINYVNLATARSGLRAREVAVRKVMGATRSALAVQFMAEALVSTAAAALIGLAVCEVVVPLVNAAGGTALTVAYLGVDGLLPIILLIILIVGVAAGIYPAFTLSAYRPAAVLASARTPGGGRAGSTVRAGLVVLQFVIAIAFTASTLIILSQTRFLRAADVGFQRSGLISVTSFFDTELTTAQRLNMLAAWKALPHVTQISVADIAPGNDDSTNRSNIRLPSQPPPGPTLNIVRTWTDFFPTLGARIVAGRALDLQHGGDTPPKDPQPDFVRNIVINEKAVKTFGFRSPFSALGQIVKDGSWQEQIVGVVADIRLRSPHDPVPPTIYILGANWASYDDQIAMVRFEGADPQAMLAAMRRVWRSIAPDTAFQAKTAVDNLQAYYRPSDVNARLFTLGAVLAVLIGCVGLYGLASFNTARRVKEIGIRKTLGASTSDVLRLLVGQLLRPVVLANLLAWPLAYLAMRSWLNGFDQRIALSPLYFIGASALMVVVALLTVVGQALAVARAEPAKALRHE